MGVRLDDDAVWELIGSSHTGILTTLRADGAPVALPVWFVVLDRTVCLATASTTSKIRRIRRDPRASFLVESGREWLALRGVHLSGEIHEVTDEATCTRIAAAIDTKYAAFRTAPERMPDATRDHYRRRTFLRLHPGPRILSWDNSRIRMRDQGDVDDS